MSDKNKRVSAADDGSVVLRLRGVRLSFADLFTPRAFEEGDDPTYSATFLMPKEGDPEKNAAYAKQAVAHVIKAGLKIKETALSADRRCLRDGALKEDTDGYDDTILFLSSGSKKKIPVVDGDLTPLGEDDGKPYSGCYVNATVRLWAQDHKKYGKRVNAQLRAVQFVKHGEAFGSGGVDV